MVGAQGQIRVTNPPHLWRSARKTPHRKRKISFFDIDYKTCWIRRGFEQLSSSIAWRVIGLQSSARNVAHAGLGNFFPLFILLNSCYNPWRILFEYFNFLTLLLFVKWNWRHKLLVSWTIASRLRMEHGRIYAIRGSRMYWVYHFAFG